MTDALDHAARIAHWTQVLADAPVAMIPSDRERGGLVAGARDRVAVTLEPEIAKAWRALAMETEATVVDVLAVVVGMFVGRYARLNDVVIGVGAPSELCPLRLVLSRHTPVRELVIRARDAAREAKRNALPPSVIASQLMDSSAAHAIFSVGVVTGVEPASGLDLAVSIHDTPESVGVWLDYDPTLWSAHAAGRMAEVLGSHLHAVASEPDRRVLPLPALSAVEQRRLVELSCGPVIAYPFIPVDEMYRERAAIDPGFPAIEHGDEIVSYGQLAERANRLANWLKRRVPRHNAVIGLVIERSPELAVAELAVWAAGHAFVPIDPETPSARGAQLLKDSSAALVLCSKDTIAAYDAGACSAVSLDAIASELAKERSEPPVVLRLAQDLAYIIFTSGSTGEPKGVALHHEGLSNFLQYDRRALKHSPDDRVTQMGSCAFDSHIEEIWTPLTNGSTLLFVDDALLLSPAAFMQWLIDKRLTRAGFSSSHFEALVDEDWSKTKLRRVGTGLEKLHRRPDSLPFVLGHGYGPTETTVGATRKVPVNEIPPPIGRPFDNYRVYVLDEDMQLLPQGALGEGFVAGPGVARGYLRADLTAERFLPDPYGPPGSRMYRTGDVLRFRDDEDLVFCGRTDAQIKIRGYRIEAGEMEAALNADPSVRASYILLTSDGGSQKRLIAYVVPRGDRKPDVQALREALGKRLPDFMIPSAFVFLDMIPLTPNGKVDKKRLPLPDAGASEYVAPSNPTEQELARMFRSVLRLEHDVGVDDDFFALGGDSLLVIQVLSAVRSSMKREVRARDFFEGPTVRRLAGLLATIGDSVAGPPKLRRSELDGVFPSLEEEFVLSWEARRDRSATWHHGYRIDMKGPLDAARMEEAVRAMVARQESLRRVFDLAQPRYGARLCLPADIAFEQIDARGETAEELERNVDERVNQPFAFGGTPLVRFALLKRAPDDHSLVVSWHEAINDATSAALVTSEIMEHYIALGEKRAPLFPELVVRYADYGKWSRDWFTQGGGREEVAAARARLASAKPLEWADRPGDGQLSTRKVGAQFLLDVPQSEHFDALCRAEAITPFSAASALVSAQLRRVSGQEDFVFVTLTNFRDAHPELVPLTGRFINPIPVRMLVGGELTWRQLFARGRAAAMAGLSSNEMAMPMSLALDAESPLDHPLARISLNLMGDMVRPTPKEAGGLTYTTHGATTMTGARNNLFFGFATMNGRWFGHVGGAADRYDLATIQMLADGLRESILGLDPSALVPAINR